MKTDNILIRYKLGSRTPNMFFRWLKNHNCYSQYLHNYHDVGQKRFEDLTTFITRQGINVIDYSFRWASTKEGHSFWQNLHSLYRQECYNMMALKK